MLMPCRYAIVDAAARCRRDACYAYVDAHFFHYCLLRYHEMPPAADDYRRRALMMPPCLMSAPRAMIITRLFRRLRAAAARAPAMICHADADVIFAARADARR